MLAAIQKIELVEDLTLVLPAQPRPWLLIILGFIGIICLIVGALWLLKRRRDAQLAAIPPEKTAVEALEALFQSLPELNPNEYALRVSQILRNYIEGQFGLRAPHRSTEEFLAEAERSTQLADAEREAIGHFLRRCDRVKFALGDLAMEGKITLHQEAKRFVDETAREAARRRQAEVLAAQAAARARKVTPGDASEPEAPRPLADFSSEYKPTLGRVGGPAPTTDHQTFTEPTFEHPPVVDEVEEAGLNPREVVGR